MDRATTTPTTTDRGYLVLADITGYTSFLSRAELDHADDILRELLSLIVGRLTAVLTLAKLEGDAVFASVPAAQLPRGETLLELIEATYVAFRDRREAVRRRTSCPCRACTAIPTLDLKFVVHVGEYRTQQVAGGRELVGAAVTLVHRLLKNQVSETTGWRAYALFTETALAQMGIPPVAMHAQTETYAHLGAVPTASLDLHARYRELTAARRVVITAEAADLVCVEDCPAPPAVVWDWLNDPQKWAHWAPDAVRPGRRPQGRTGVGAENHCVHGTAVQLETVVDWRPFAYFTVEVGLSLGTLTVTVRLEPQEGGTRLHIHARLTPKVPVPGPLRRRLVRRLAPLTHAPRGYAALARRLSAELTAAPAPVH